MVEAPEKIWLSAPDEVWFEDSEGRTEYTRSDIAERQIAELRAEYLNASKDAMELAGKLNAPEAENARLRALPLKDEVERVLEQIDEQITDTYEKDGDGYYDTPLTYTLRAASALLSRLRAGEQEGWKLVPADPDLAEHLIRAALVAGYKGVGSTDEEAEALADAKMTDPKELAFSKAQYAGMLAAAPSEQGGDRG